MCFSIEHSLFAANGLHSMYKFPNGKLFSHMNSYSKEIFYNHVMKFLSEKLITNNSCQYMNDENKYTVVMPFIGHPSIIFKKSLTKNFKSINEKKGYAIFKAFKVQNYFSLKDETPPALQSYVIYFLKILVVRTEPILIEQNDSWLIGLGSIFLEIHPFLTYIFLQHM